MKARISAWPGKTSDLLKRGRKLANSRGGPRTPRRLYLEKLDAREYLSADLTSLASAMSDPESLVVVTDDIAEHVVRPGDGYDGVVWLGAQPFQESRGGFNCSGSLLESGWHILTAAHCITDSEGRFRFASTSVDFSLLSSTKQLMTKNYYIHPDWGGESKASNSRT